MRQSGWRRTFLVAVPALALAACGGLRSNKPAEQIYVLHAAAPAARQAAVVPGVLRVPRPEIQPGLETSRIALARAGNELDYFADSRWGETLPRVLSAFFVESLVHAGQFETVIGSTAGTVPADFDLLITVRHFEADYGSGGTPRAHVALDCVLIAGAPRRILGRCDAEAVEAAADNRMAPIVAALQRAAQKAMADAADRAAVMARAVRK